MWCDVVWCRVVQFFYVALVLWIRYQVAYCTRNATHCIGVSAESIGQWRSLLKLVCQVHIVYPLICTTRALDSQGADRLFMLYNQLSTDMPYHVLVFFSR